MQCLVPRMLGLGLLAGAGAACGEPSSAAVPVQREAAAPDQWSHAIVFDGEVTVGQVHGPDRVEPGQSLELRWQAQGEAAGLTARVTAWPPRAGARQVAKGGVGAPLEQLPLDPRAVVVEVPLDAGGVQLPLPAPWHPPQVLVTLELLDGDARVPAISGPRRHDGVAQLALVDVVPRPTTLLAPRAATAPVLDGRLDDAVWQQAFAHPMVHSLDGEPYDDRPSTVRMAWDARALYVAAEIEDPDVWSDFSRRDDPLWNQEVFEVFVFGDAERRGYLELQVSPRGTVFDARFERYRKGDQAWNGRWQAAVDLRGSLDERRDRDQGWSAELAIPWEEICAHTEVSCPVDAGTSLRINAFRFERPARRDPIGLALSPPRVPDFHAPENAAVLELGGT